MTAAAAEFRIVISAQDQASLVLANMFAHMKAIARSMNR